MKNITSLIMLLASLTAAIASSIELYIQLKARLKIKVGIIPLRAKKKEMKCFLLRVFNKSSFPTEIIEFWIRASKGVTPRLMEYSVNDLPSSVNLIYETIEPQRVITGPKAIYRGPLLYIKREGIIPWYLPGKGFVDLPICITNTESNINNILKVKIVSTHKTFDKKLKIN